MSRSSSSTKGKTKISQNDLRRFMNAEKRKLSLASKRIDSPLAKYLDNGTLTCIVCESVVRSESVWTIHLNSKVHKENVLRRKQEQTAPPPPPPPVESHPKPVFKRPPSPLSVTDVTPPKKLKGILKNAPSLPPGFFDDVVVAPKAPPSCAERMEEDQERINDGNQEETAPLHKMEVDIPPRDIPEGFFDDPHLDAKARNVEYKDPIQDEWDRFQKEIQEENTVSSQLIQDDTEVATVERQIVEVDEQLRKWSKVLDLEVKKEQVKSKTVIKARDIKKEESSSDDESEADEFLDWRAKRAFK